MVPRQTLFTDTRLGDRLWDILDTLPPGSGVVVRDAHLEDAEAIAAIAHRRGLILSIKGDAALARRLGAAFVHKPLGDASGIPVSLPVHDEAQARDAYRLGAAVVYVSPVFATASHPGAPALGPIKARRLAALAHAPAIALGGMDEMRFADIGDGFAGWAGITPFL